MPTTSLRVRWSDDSVNILILPICADGECRQLAVCVAAREAAARGGHLGASLASVLTVNMAARLSVKYQESEADIMAATQSGISGQNCSALHPCSKPLKTFWTFLLDELSLYSGIK